MGKPTYFCFLIVLSWWRTDANSWADIGFGLYCERSRAVLDVLGLDKWVELEILTCMWRNASQRTRDSFRQLSKVSIDSDAFLVHLLQG